MKSFNAYWDAWAPYWEHLEDFFFEEESLNTIINDLESPVLIVGAGLGLIVEVLKNKGIKCDGLDISPQMVKQAKSMRNLALIQGDAAEMPFANKHYQSCITASGVIDFMEDETQILKIIQEMLRVTSESGKLFIAFGHFSPAMEAVCRELGVIEGNHLHLRKSLQYSAAVAAMSMEELGKQPAVGTQKEQKFGMGYYKVFNEVADPEQLIRVAPETQHYRSKDEIKDLFKRLSVRIKDFKVTETAYIVQI